MASHAGLVYSHSLKRTEIIFFLKFWMGEYFQVFNKTNVALFTYKRLVL